MKPTLTVPASHIGSRAFYSKTMTWKACKELGAALWVCAGLKKAILYYTDKGKRRQKTYKRVRLVIGI